MTNTCGETWYGIVVKGQDSLGQSPLYQGMITMNDALIEHSRYEVRLHNGWLSQHSGGGIIEAENTTFKNNWHAVDFSQYHNTNNIYTQLFNEEVPNISKFRDCIFTVDDDLRDFQTTKPFSGHIGMWDVTGVKILGCRFENLQSSFTKAEDGGHGIVSVDAQFYVTQDCNGIVPCSSYDTTSFYRLLEGVRVANISSINSAEIDKCVFKSCHYGIFNDGADLLSVTRSRFEVGGFPINKTGTYLQEGVVLNNATAFTITENIFLESDENINSSYEVGIRLADAGDDANQIYKNEIEGIFFGNLANGDNANESLSNSRGTLYECNSFQDNISDITAYAGDPSIQLVIARNQGSNNQAAGNTFSDAIAFNINNYDSLYQDQITYFYYNGNSDEEPNDTKNTLAVPITDENACTSQLPGSSGSNGTVTYEELSSSQVTGLTNTFWAASSSYHTNSATYNNNIDRGNTAGLIADVEATTEGDAASLLNDLEGESPWLSESVLKAVVDNNEILAEDIVPLLEQHPDVLRKLSFMNYLKDSDRFTSNHLETLYAAMSSSTTRTDLESNISAYASRKFATARKIMRNYLNDTTLIEGDSLAIWLTREKSLNSSYMLVELYRQQKDWAKAAVILDDIQDDFSLTTKQNAAYNDYKELHQILYSTDTAGLHIFELPNEDYNAVQTLAAKGYERAHVQAQTILNYGYGADYRRPPLFPLEVEERPIFEEKEEDISTESILVQPNPAKDWVSIRIQKEDWTNAQLMITDSYGHILLEQQLNVEKTELQLNTSNWAAGTYFAILQLNGEKPEVTPFVIAK